MPKYQLLYHYKDTEQPFLNEGIDLEDPENWDGQEVIYFTTDEPLGQVYDDDGNGTKDTDRLKAEILEVHRAIFKETGHTGITFDSIVEVDWDDE